MIEAIAFGLLCAVVCSVLDEVLNPRRSWDEDQKW